MNIIIIGDYNPDYPPHPATTKSLEHVREKNNFDIQIKWIDTERIIGPFKEFFRNTERVFYSKITI